LGRVPSGLSVIRQELGWLCLAFVTANAARQVAAGLRTMAEARVSGVMSRERLTK
jgi:hypothetical protein